MGRGEADEDQELVGRGFDDEQAFGDVELLLGQEPCLGCVEDAHFQRLADAVAIGGRIGDDAGLVEQRHRPEGVGQKAADIGGALRQVDPAQAIGQFGIEPERIGLARRDRRQDHHGIVGLDIGDARPHRLLGKAGQRQDDDDVDDAAQHQSAQQPEQETRHAQRPRTMVGMTLSLEKPEKAAVS